MPRNGQLGFQPGFLLIRRERTAILVMMSAHDVQWCFGAWGGVLCLVVCLAAPGCELKGGPGAVKSDVKKIQIWRIRPTSMRIYPSSEFRVVGGQPAVEARIELFDDLGDSIKGVGRVRFELDSLAKPGASGVGKRLYQWEIPMLTKEKNAKFYDVVTRSYRFELKMDEAPEPGKPLRLIAEFIDAEPGGKRLSAEATLTPQP